MDIYSLSRSFFDWSFENPEKVTPNHTALYFFAIEHCNRLWWKKKFWFPTSMAKDAIWIKSYNTYSKVFNELVEWWFFELIEKSTNQYSANIIALSNFDKALDKALDKAMIKHVWKQRDSTCESIDSIDIHNTNIPIYKDTNIPDIISKDIIDKSTEKKDNRDKNIDSLLNVIKESVELEWFIYKKWKYERERAKNILTWKDFLEICNKSNMTPTEFCKNIIFISSKLDFWRWKIYNAETLYTHYPKVYNDALSKKQEIEQSRPRSIII